MVQGEAMRYSVIQEIKSPGGVPIKVPWGRDLHPEQAAAHVARIIADAEEYERERAAGVEHSQFNPYLLNITIEVTQEAEEDAIQSPR
jgi:hypothetical protein